MWPSFPLPDFPFKVLGWKPVHLSLHLYQQIGFYFLSVCLFVSCVPRHVIDWKKLRQGGVSLNSYRESPEQTGEAPRVKSELCVSVLKVRGTKRRRMWDSQACKTNPNTQPFPFLSPLPPGSEVLFMEETLAL